MLTRKELYELVWSRPMTHVAKEFGVSDVAVKKHCKKQDIPTPPVGYWVKVKYGKRVRQPRLSTRNYPADQLVQLVPKEIAPVNAESLEAAEAVRSRIEFLDRVLKVPERLPRNPHPLVQTIRARLKEVTPDTHGMYLMGSTWHPTVRIGRGSIQRVLRILSTLAKVAEKEGHRLFEQDEDIYWQVGEEKFCLRIRETENKKPHQPTRLELKMQAEQDKRRAEHPDWYNSERKAYRTWDYSSSGRISLHVFDANYSTWGRPEIQKWCRYRKEKPLESRMAEIFVWLGSAEVLARENRLKREEEERIKEDARAARRLKRKRREQAGKLEKYLLEMARNQQDVTLVADLLRKISSRKDQLGWSMSRIIEELQSYNDYLETRYGPDRIETFFESIELEENGPLLIPILSESDANIERGDLSPWGL